MFVSTYHGTGYWLLPVMMYPPALPYYYTAADTPAVWSHFTAACGLDDDRNCAVCMYGLLVSDLPGPILTSQQTAAKNLSFRDAGGQHFSHRAVHVVRRRGTIF